jgi:hypothetical protein
MVGVKAFLNYAVFSWGGLFLRFAVAGLFCNVFANAFFVGDSGGTKKGGGYELGKLRSDFDLSGMGVVGGGRVGRPTLPMD